MDDLARVLAAHPFLAELDPEHVSFLVGCTKNVRFRAGDHLVSEGDREDTLYLIRQGGVAIEMRRAGGEVVCVETIGAGDVIGISLLAEAASHLDCRARESVVAFAIDSACMLRKMTEEPRLGFALAMRLLARTYERLSRARLQHLDIYR